MGSKYMIWAGLTLEGGCSILFGLVVIHYRICNYQSMINYYYYDIKIYNYYLLIFRLLNWISDKRTFLILAIILRFVQGLGAACYVTAAYSVVATLFRQSIATTMVPHFN